MNARCIRAGTVNLRPRVAGEALLWTMIVELARPAPVHDGTLTLVAASPGRVAGHTRGPGVCDSCSTFKIRNDLVG
jgi:hypothetical protein